MKKLKLLLAMGVVLSALVLKPVYAEDGEDTGTGDESTSENESTTADDKKKTAEERIAEYKAKRAEKLASAEERRIKAKCKAAQGLVKALEARTNNIKANRSKVYKEIGDKLDNLIEKLKAANIDTTELEAARTTIQTKVDDLNVKIEAYQQTLSDLSELDCETDPEAFKAALETARDEREAVATAAKELRTYVKDSLKPILQKLRAELEAQNASSDDSDSEAETSTDSGTGGN